MCAIPRDLANEINFLFGSLVDRCREPTRSGQGCLCAPCAVGPISMLVERPTRVASGPHGLPSGTYRARRGSLACIFCMTQDRCFTCKASPAAVFGRNGNMDLKPSERREKEHSKMADGKEKERKKRRKRREKRKAGNITRKGQERNKE